MFNISTEYTERIHYFFTDGADIVEDLKNISLRFYIGYLWTFIICDWHLLEKQDNENLVHNYIFLTISVFITMRDKMGFFSINLSLMCINSNIYVS